MAGRSQRIHRQPITRDNECYMQDMAFEEFGNRYVRKPRGWRDTRRIVLQKKHAFVGVVRYQVIVVQYRRTAEARLLHGGFEVRRQSLPKRLPQIGT